MSGLGAKHLGIRLDDGTGLLLEFPVRADRAATGLLVGDLWSARSGRAGVVWGGVESGEARVVKVEEAPW
ncbi:hypothetical protein BN6_31530 [Saccharothrix espanaensis DSM 44229]|uniref:Uncharacterized protein n=1 Tax=Saccharothrix espanaensis (strain ATCC 51144 / DSM 44229 / JCM 9112 / NBRC 15066 / NRRL 15764) TaxID=1179773 RepID=K0JYU2_SACES|nr:hypothetical protein BN6_31530 [Saccharothrix espanaensis DSM 44229]